MAVHALHPRRFALLLLLLLALTMLMACSSTQLVNMWKDPTGPAQPVGSVLVVTLRQSATSRRLWEDGFVKALREKGVQATPSYELFPGGAPDTTALLGAVRQRGFQGMILAHRLGVDTLRRWVPGYVNTEPVTLLNPWTGNYYNYWTDVYRPGYAETDQVVRYETEFWTTAGRGRLVWSGTTESLNPSSSETVNQEIAKRIVPELIRQRVVGK